MKATVERVDKIQTKGFAFTDMEQGHWFMLDEGDFETIAMKTGDEHMTYVDGTEGKTYEGFGPVIPIKVHIQYEVL